MDLPRYVDLVMIPGISFSILEPTAHADAAALIHRSLVHWYETRLRQGARFGESCAPFLLFPQVYEALDPGDSVAAFDQNGRLVGVCFLHPRETHVGVGIVAVEPEFAGRGIARSFLNRAVDRARELGKPLRLVSSLLNLESFSLYSRMGFVPHTLYQDLFIEVPITGLASASPPGVGQVRIASPDEARRIADFEFSLQGIRRQKDFEFFLQNSVGAWTVWIFEEVGGEIAGVLVSSQHPDWGMLGPGIATHQAAALALMWCALDTRRGQGTVALLPCVESELVRALYGWGARNIELHVAQVLGERPPAQGIAFPTFLPESA